MTDIETQLKDGADVPAEHSNDSSNSPETATTRTRSDSAPESSIHNDESEVTISHSNQAGENPKQMFKCASCDNILATTSESPETPVRDNTAAAAAAASASMRQQEQEAAAANIHQHEHEHEHEHEQQVIRRASNDGGKIVAKVTLAPAPTGKPKKSHSP